MKTQKRWFGGGSEVRVESDPQVHVFLTLWENLKTGGHVVKTFKKIVFKPQCIWLKFITGETVDEHKSWQKAVHQLPEQHLDENVQNNGYVFQYLWLDAQSKAKVSAPIQFITIKHQFQAFHVLN